MEEIILIIEDEENIANFMKTNFELAGFKVELAYDGEEAIETLTRLTPGLIILDLMIPKIDGWEVLNYLHKHKKERVPVIITSAKTQKRDIEKGLSFGVDDYITKPFDPLELVEKVRSILSSRK